MKQTARKVASCLMVLALCLGMTPMTARADDPHTHDDVTFTAWEHSDNLPTFAGSYYLTTDVQISDTWDIPSGTTNLCLNGYGIRLTGSGSVIAVDSGATLNLYDCNGSTSTHKFDVPADGAAGLATLNETSGTYTLTGGYITGGYRNVGGGVRVEEGGTFTMHGGTILGNRADGNSDQYGGGVDVNGGTFTMDGGAISYNYAKNFGGGVAVMAGTFTLKEGEISFNQTKGAGGGGIALRNSGKLYLYGGRIINNGNIDHWEQGGIDCDNNNCELHIKGAPVVKDNTCDNGSKPCNISLRTAICITLDGALTTGASIHMHRNHGDRVFTSGWSTYMNNANPADYFTSDNNAYDVILSGTEVALGAAPVASVTDTETTTNYTVFEGQDGALGHWTTGSTLTLLKDVTTTSTIVVSEGTKTLDLNGYGINANRGSFSVIAVPAAATLTINDSSPNTPHKFTVASAASNGAGLATVNDALTGTEGTNYQTFTGGYITGGNAASGGGVCVNGGTLTMTGGTVIGNYAQYGGGVYVCDNGTFRLNGGTITGNDAHLNGGGIFIYNNGTLNISGSVRITGNTADGGTNNVYIPDGKTITITGALASTASIGVTMQTPGVFAVAGTDYTITDDDASRFTSDVAGYVVGKNEDGQLYLAKETLYCLSGTIQCGSSASDVSVSLTQQNEQELSDSDTDPLTYTFAGLHAGTYTLRVEWTESGEPKDVTHTITVPIPPEGGT